MINHSQALVQEPVATLLAPPLPTLHTEREERIEDRRSMNLFNSKIESREKPGSGRGVFALESIAPGEVIAAWGGRVTLSSEFTFLPESVRKLSLQIEDDFFLIPQGGENAADFINHSCDPNAGMAGQILVVAMRAIEAGEEICYDYAMSDGSGYDEFECCCGTAYCRGKITGSDWSRTELWSRYEGYFSPYLARRIEQIKASLHSRQG